MTTPLTSEQAIDLLRRNPDAYRTPEQLRALAAQVDANAPGRITVLYSGPIANGVWSTDVVNAMLEAGEDVRVINRSQAAKFFTTDDFYHAVAKAHGIGDFRSLADGTYRGPSQGAQPVGAVRFAHEKQPAVHDSCKSIEFDATEICHEPNH